VRNSLLACGEGEIEEDVTDLQIGDTNDLAIIAATCGDDAEIDQNDLLPEKNEKLEFSSGYSDAAKVAVSGIPFAYTKKMDLFFYTLGDENAGEVRSVHELWEKEIKPKAIDYKKGAGSVPVSKFKETMFDEDSKVLMNQFLTWFKIERVKWPGQNDIFVAKKTLEMYCSNFLRALKIGGSENDDGVEALSTKALYDVSRFLERICEQNYSVGTLSIILLSVIRVMEKHPDILVGENESLTKQYHVLREAYQISVKECGKIAISRFQSDVYPFDYNDVLDAIVKIFDGKLAWEERQLIRKFGSRAGLGSIFLVYSPKEESVQAFLGEGHGVILIESTNSLDKEKNYSDVDTALPEGLKVHFKRRRSFNEYEVEKTTIFMETVGDEAMARILLSIYLTAIRDKKEEDAANQQSPAVQLLEAHEKRGFSGRFSWLYRIFRLIQELGCRDDLGSVQLVHNPTREQMDNILKNRENVISIMCEDLDLNENYLKVRRLPKDLEILLILLRHKTSGSNKFTPSRKIESEEVLRILLDIYVEKVKEDKEEEEQEKKEKKEEEEKEEEEEEEEKKKKKLYFVIPRRLRLVRGKDMSISHMITDVLKKLQCEGKNLKDISKAQAVTFLRKLLSSTLFNDAKVDERVIDGKVLSDQAEKLWHSVIVHVKYYLRMIQKSKERMDLAAHFSEEDMKEIRDNWDQYLMKKKASYSWEELQFILMLHEVAYLGPPSKKAEEMTEDEKRERRKKLFESMVKRKNDSYVREDKTLNKATLLEITKELIDAKFGIKRTVDALKFFINVKLETYEITESGFISMFTEENPSEENLRDRRELIESVVNDAYIGEEGEKVKKYVQAAATFWEKC